MKVDPPPVTSLINYPPTGALAAAIYIKCQTAPYLIDLFEKHPGWGLFVTGHSLGGGVAAVLSMILKYEKALPPGAGALQCTAIGSAAGVSCLECSSDGVPGDVCLM